MMDTLLDDNMAGTRQNKFTSDRQHVKSSDMRSECETAEGGNQQSSPSAAWIKAAGLLESVRSDRMNSSCCRSARPQTLKVWCVRMCWLYSAVCLAAWPLSSQAAQLRCGSDLLSDLIFVCGDRGIYLGKGTWSGYGTRPRGKGIVDQCCRPAGCELQHLELYCAKPKSTTAFLTTTTAPLATTQLDAAQQFQGVFQKRLLEHLGAPDSPQRDAHRKKTQRPSLRRKGKVSSSRRRIKTQNVTSRPPSASAGPRFKS